MENLIKGAELTFKEFADKPSLVISILRMLLDGREPEIEDAQRMKILTERETGFEYVFFDDKIIGTLTHCDNSGQTIKLYSFHPRKNKK